MVAVVWHTGADVALFDGTLDWVNDPAEVSLHGPGYVPDVDHLTQGVLSAELSGTGYTRLALTAKTLDVTGPLTATLGAADSVWPGLNAGAARTAVIQLTSGAVLGHLDLLDSTGATDLDAAGGGARIAWTPAEIVVPPPPPGSWGAASAAESLGFSTPVGSTSLQVPQKMTDWATFVRPARCFVSFAFDGEASSWASQETVLDRVSKTTGTANRLSGHDSIHVLTIPLVRKATASAGETQASIGQTLADAAGGSNDAHYVRVGQILHANACDVRHADGRPKSAIRLGWEANGEWYPWYLRNDPANFKVAYDRAIAKMVEGGLDQSEVEIVYNINTLGTCTRDVILTAFPDSATVFTVDFYDMQQGPLYSDHPGNELAYAAEVFALRVGNPNPALDSKVSGHWAAKVAADRGLYFGIDEWGLLTAVVPPANLLWHTGGKDNPIYISLMHAFLEGIVSQGRLAWAAYFDYDVTSTGLLHKVSGTRHPNAKVRFVELFG